MPSKIEQLSNKGKFIYLKLKDNYIVGIKLNYAHLVDHDGKHSNIQFETSKGSFYIEDLRNFGTITILNNEELNKTLQKIGPDLIHTKVSFKEYEEVNGQGYLKFGDRSDDLCAILVITVLSWENKLKYVGATKGRSYVGAEFKNLKFNILQDSLNTFFIFKDFDYIID